MGWCPDFEFWGTQAQRDGRRQELPGAVLAVARTTGAAGEEAAEAAEAGAFSLPFLDLPLPFLDLPLPFHCLSLTCSMPLGAPANVGRFGGVGGVAGPILEAARLAAIGRDGLLLGYVQATACSSLRLSLRFHGADCFCPPCLTFAVAIAAAGRAAAGRRR